MLGTILRGGLLAIGLAGAVSTALAQEPPTRMFTTDSPEIEQTAGPGSVGWPELATPSQPLPPPTVLEEVRTPAGIYDDTPAIVYADSDPLFRPNYPPLPGSLDDLTRHEAEAKRGFRAITPNGGVVTAMPAGLLWQPPLASKQEPRMLLLPTSLDNATNSWTLDTSIGGTIPMFRYEPIGRDLSYQFDIAAVVHTRLTPEDLLTSDYRFAFPLSAAWGRWHGKLAYEHTSSHLGDELIRGARPLNIPIPSAARDEVVVGIGRWVMPQLRLYVQAGYAFFLQLPDRPTMNREDRVRFDVGAEWYCPGPTGLRGQPYGAFNINSRGDEDFRANFNIQAGWMWRNPYQRFGTIRLFGEYYNGRSPYGQLRTIQEDFFAIGLAADY